MLTAKRFLMKSADANEHTMKRMQEFSDEPNKVFPSAELILKRMEKLPLPYTGNKKKILHLIYDAINKHDIEFNTILDAFSGSGGVSFLFKLMGKRVIANDLLTSSYINAVAFVENPGITLTEEEKQFLLTNENQNKNTFVEDNYLGQQFCTNGHKTRFSKFTAKECHDLDNFRANVDELYGIHAQGLSLAANAAVVLRLPFGNVDQSIDVLKHRKRQEKAYGRNSKDHDRRIGIYYDDDYNLNFNKWFRKYVSDFTIGKMQEAVFVPKIKRAAFLANLQQHVLRDANVGGRLNNGQSLAEINHRLGMAKNQLKGASWDNSGSTAMDFLTQAGKPGQGMKWWTFAQLDRPGSCLATNMDTTELLKSGVCDVDCVYFDPPYGGNSSDYSAIYRFLEEYVYSTPLEELPHIVANAQKFVGKKSYEHHFVEMLEAARHIPIWLFSYNDSSWKDIEYIKSIISQFKDDVVIETLTEKYRYFYRKKQGRDKKSHEYLIIAR